MKQEMENFEQKLDEKPTKTAITEYYKENAVKIGGAILTISILLGLALIQAPVWVKGIVVIAIISSNYALRRKN